MSGIRPRGIQERLFQIAIIELKWEPARKENCESAMPILSQVQGSRSEIVLIRRFLAQQVAKKLLHVECILKQGFFSLRQGAIDPVLSV
jgi:hypothetical protein